MIKSLQRWDVGGWRSRSILWPLYALAMIALLTVLLWPAVAQAAHTVTLSWTAPVSGTPTGYNVYKLAGVCGPSLPNFTKLNSAPITALTFTDTGLADGVTACYQVTAVYPTGESGSSGALQITTSIFTATVVLTPPGAPSASVQ